MGDPNCAHVWVVDAARGHEYVVCKTCHHFFPVGDMLATIARLTRERDEAWAFLRRTAMTGGSIVSSAAMTAQQIAIARAADRMIVMPDGYGFVYVPGPRGEEP